MIILTHYNHWKYKPTQPKFMIMKISMLFTAILLIAAPGFTQVNKPTKTKEEYLKTAKALKATGWVLIGGGTIAVIVGSNISAHAAKKPDAKGLTETGVGLLSGLIGLPFLIGGDNMAKKAKNMELSSRRTALPNMNGLTVWQPTISWKFAIR